jgi:diguanylate cyclase (GGDEF)-like protein
VKITLIQKLIASYAAIVCFTLAALVFSLYGLFSLNRTARDIANNDLTVISSLSRLRTSLLAQEGYAGKYSILKSAEFVALFQQRERDFLATMSQLAGFGPDRDIAVIGERYGGYRIRAAQLFAGNAVDTRQLRETALTVLAAIDKSYDDRHFRLQEKLAGADAKQRATVTWTLILSFAGFLLALAVAVVFSYRTSTALHRLKLATHRIAEGDFDFDPRIPPGDEIGDLARDFTSMAARLKVLEQMSLDASPLTRLPGNIAIERVLNRRLQHAEHFAVCYADLDNFKAFNDRYGYIQGSELIRETGEIIYNVVRSLDSNESFVGHVGGDDFVMVVQTDNVAAVCEAVIAKFGTAVVRHYSAEDVAAGGAEGVDRYGVARFFPLVTISIAVIICGRGEFDSAVEIARAAAEIKDYVKEKPGSSYFVSRRKQPR